MTVDIEKDVSQLKTDIAVILERTKVLPDMSTKLNAIDRKQSGFEEKLKNHEKDICDLQKKSDTWDLMNTFVSVIAAIGAAISGIFGAN